MDGIGCHDAEQRGIGDVDERVDHHHQRIGHIGVDRPGARRPVGRQKKEDSAHPERQGAPQQIGSELAPSAVRPVGNGPENGIVHRIPDPRNEEHRPDNRGRKSEDVGIEEEQIHAEELPEHRRCRISQAVSDLLLQSDFTVFHRPVEL